MNAVGRFALLGSALLTAGGLISGCGSAAGQVSTAKLVYAVGAENEYSNVIQQIGGRYVKATGIMSNPTTDPHTYEASTADASLVSKATLVVQNGVGYDSFMNHLEAASPNSHRTVITVGLALGYGATTKNPHLWYNPKTMPKVAQLIGKALSKKIPSERAYFEHRVTVFDKALKSYDTALAQLKSAYAGAGVAVTEPVADYLLQAAGMKIKTPWTFQAAIMNGTDPSPQDVQIEDNLLKKNRVKVLVYNHQAVDSTTDALLSIARTHHIPVVGVYETMPLHYSYQQWMTAEVHAVLKALKYGKSTVTM